MEEQNSKTDKKDKNGKDEKMHKRQNEKDKKMRFCVQTLKILVPQSK